MGRDGRTDGKTEKSTVTDSPKADVLLDQE